MDSSPHKPADPASLTNAGSRCAVFLLGGDGRIIRCTAEAAPWWRSPDPAGRLFTELFYFEAPADGGDAAAAAWALLRAAGVERSLTLQARVDGGGFEALVRLLPLGEAPEGSIAFAATVMRAGPGPDAVPTEEGAVASGAATPAATWDNLADSGVGFFALDLAAGKARLSDSWKRLLGYGPAEVGDDLQAVADLLHPDDSEAVPGREGRGPPDATTRFSAEARLRSATGAWRWMQFEGVQHFDTDGRPDRATGVMLDAQERRDIEEESFRNEDRFRQLTGRGRAGYFEINFAADTAWFSEEFRHLLGYRADELPASPDAFMRLLPPEEAEAGGAAFFQRLGESKTGLCSRFRLRHKNARWVEVEGFIIAQRNRRGEVERACGLHAAVAAAPAASDQPSGAATDPALLAARQALDAVGEIVVVVDRAGKVLFANVRASRAAGGPPESLPGRAVEQVFPLVDRIAGAPVPGVVGRCLAGGRALELDSTYALAPHAGGGEVLLTCRPWLDGDGRAAGAVVILRQPAEMPLSPAELVASNRMEALGRLACGVAHDFNNLLTTVTGGISLALEKREWAPLETAEKACTSAKNLARQLLVFARGTAPGRKAQPLNELVRETVRMAAAGSKITLQFELSPDLHPVEIDAAQFVQVFANLALNAVQAMPGGGHLWVRTLDMPLGQVNSAGLPAGDYVRADVQDDGPGMPPEIVARIFEPFFTTKPGGTGLGLAMVRSIVAEHDGAVEVTSAPGVGTTFTLFLPRASQQPVKETPRPPSVAYGTGRVLVMDDDPDLCMIARGMLEMLGYDAEATGNAADTIAVFRRQHDLGRPFHAVILDLTMAGGLGGEDVLARLREIDPTVKAIVSSGYATEDQAEHYQKIGFAGMLSKPYRSADLGRAIKLLLGKTT